MEQIKVIEDNREALLWRLRMIGSATEKIVLIAYKMRIDESGKDVVCALYEAAKRGVEEYIVIDYLSSKLFISSFVELKQLVSLKNVHFYFYNPIRPGKIRLASCRLHDKILAIDDKYYMTGGRNLLDLSIGGYVDTYNIDRDTVVMPCPPDEKAASIDKVNAYIELLLACKYLSRYKAEPDMADVAASESLQARYEAITKKDSFIIKNIDDISGDGFLPVKEVRSLHCSVTAHRKKPDMWDELVSYMKGGKDVLVQTPYIMCNKKMYKDLEQIARGRDFAIITNSIDSGANIFGCVDYLNQKDKFIKKRIKIYECREEHSLHTKTILIDDDISIIGSFNFDVRSAYIDTETMLFIRSKEINRQLRETAENLIEKSITRDKHGNEIYGSLYKKGEIGVVKSIICNILRVLIIPFRRLL